MSEPTIKLLSPDGEILATGEEAYRWLETGSPERPVSAAGETRWQSMDYTGRGGQGPTRPSGPDRTGADLIGLRGPTRKEAA
jgi:hypothetical protein